MTLQPSPCSQLALTGAVSGILSIPAALFIVLPGVIFGVAVLLPFRGLVKGWWPRAIGSGLIGVLAFFVASFIVLRPSDAIPPVQYAAIGGMAALIVGKGALVMLGLPWQYRVLGLMVAAGVILGALADLMVALHVPILIYPAWQAAVAAPLGILLAEFRSSRERQMSSGPNMNPSTRGKLVLSVLPGSYAVARSDRGATIPDWIGQRPDGPGLFSVTITNKEMSIVCPEGPVPPDVEAERGWRVLEVEGPLPFTMTGVLASIATPLAEAKITLFTISTFDTDYLLVPGRSLDQAATALRVAGHEIRDT